MISQALRFLYSGLCLGGIAVGACDRAEPTALSSTRQLSTSQSIQLHDLAHAFSTVLADPASRLELLHQLRQSPYTMHRLELGTLLGDPASKRLARSLAEAVGMSPAQLRTAVSRAGAVDVVVPYRDDRRIWTGTDDLVVFSPAAPDPDGRVPGYLLGGASASIKLGQRTPGLVQLVLEPGQTKYIRIDPQENRPGRVIEEPADGTMGGMLTMQLPNGSYRAFQLADIRRRDLSSATTSCDPPTPECPPDEDPIPPPAADTTILAGFEVYFGDCHGGADPSFIATYYINGIPAGSGRLDYSEVPDSHTWLTVNDILIFKRIHDNADERIHLRIVEDDSWICGGDDEKGSRNWYYFDRDVTRTVFTGDGVPSAEVRLNWTQAFR